jgi:hypothetical protein
MTHYAAGASGAISGRGQAGRVLDDATRHRHLLGRRLLRRGRQASGAPPSRGRWACPDCGLSTQDPVAFRLGFCARCDEFTGMCGAGRKIICPDMMTMTTWHTPCTNLGAVAWQLSQGLGPRVTLLCPEHDAELLAGRTSWLSQAVRLEDLTDP